MIVFEFDKNKSQINLEKHKIDFTTAQKLWDDPDLLEVSAKTVDEPLAIVIGMSREALVWRDHLSR